MQIIIAVLIVALGLGPVLYYGYKSENTFAERYQRKPDHVLTFSIVWMLIVVFTLGIIAAILF